MIHFLIDQPKNDHGNNCASKKSHIETSAALLNVPAKASWGRFLWDFQCGSSPREGLFALVKGTPDSLHYENGLTVANGDYVLLHGRFTGMGLPANWIVVDIVHLENGQLAEHLDVIEDEATKEASVSGMPMFGTTFPSG
jgi:hypothetical protein